MNLNVIAKKVFINPLIFTFVITFLEVVVRPNIILPNDTLFNPKRS